MTLSSGCTAAACPGATGANPRITPAKAVTSGTMAHSIDPPGSTAARKSSPLSSSPTSE
ncbi:MAG: hypothetical protein M5U28_50595 [Sandaracinaceae bacterium]|nr:hypothetical protein [Sandaracinaceae bacterium]